jgi:hypothetical protein
MDRDERRGSSIGPSTELDDLWLAASHSAGEAFKSLDLDGVDGVVHDTGDHGITIRVTARTWDTRPL